MLKAFVQLVLGVWIRIYDALYNSALFLSLSSLLANTTSNMTYTEAAAQSFEFINSHFFNSTQIPTNFTVNSITLTSCTPVTDTSIPLTLDVSIIIESLAIQGMVTGNSSLTTLYDFRELK